MTELVKTEGYEGPNRRKYVKTLEQLERDITAMFEAHEAREKQWIEEIRDDLLKAFPNGDVGGHCDAHEAMIKAKKAEEEFWQAAKTEAIKNGVAGMFAVLKIVVILAIVGGAFKIGVGPAVAKMLGVTP